MLDRLAISTKWQIAICKERIEAITPGEWLMILSFGGMAVLITAFVGYKILA